MKGTFIIPGQARTGEVCRAIRIPIHMEFRIFPCQVPKICLLTKQRRGVNPQYNGLCGEEGRCRSFLHSMENKSKKTDLENERSESEFANLDAAPGNVFDLRNQAPFNYMAKPRRAH